MQGTSERSCQGRVRAGAHDASMPSESENVIHQLAVGAAAIAEIVRRAHTRDDVTTVVAAALFAPDDEQRLMARADSLAVTSRDRQLVQIAGAHLHGDADRVEHLARDHLADHPDSVLVAWITSASTRANPTRSNTTRANPTRANTTRVNPTRTEHP